MSKLLRKNTRRLSAATLIASAMILLMFVFVDRSRSANPANGTIGPAGPDVVWDGTAPGGTSEESEDTCVEGVNCDTFLLTISGTPADWIGKQVHLEFTWIDPVNDYDVYIHKGADNTGDLVGSSANTHLETNYERIDLDPNQPAIGTGVFSVHVVYYIVTPQTGVGPAPANDQYHAVASAVVAALPSPSPTPGGSPTPPPIPPGTPRFVNHYAPPGVLEDAGEPTIGVNWNSENFPGRGLYKNKFRSGTENIILNGGTSLYYGGINNYFLRATFDDCSSPATVQWDQIALTTGNATRVFYDPILFTDHLTGRTFVCQEVGLTPGGSTIEFTDDDGETMHPSQGGAPSGGLDHQTIGGGPFHAPAPPTTVTPKVPPDPAATPYPHAVYYASQDVGSATSQLSLDGGFSYPVQTPMYTSTDCEGLHGHLKVAEDGTAYLPNKACGLAPRVLGGNPAVLVSENNGATWTIRLVEAADSDVGVDDASVGVSWCPPGPAACDKADRSNHIYLGFMYTDGRPGIAYSNNKGQNWVNVTDLGAQTGIKHIAFPAVAVGDPDRAVFSFFGTTTAGNYSAPEFPGIWHLYVATTFDAGQTWSVQNVTPNDPIQRGGICGEGTCRNLLDFFDATIDKQGRILIAGEDGCIGGCVLGGANSFTAKAFISRQSGGKRMFSIYDPQTVEPALPGAPFVNGSVNDGNTEVTLAWQAPDNGGSTITAYKIYRAATQAGPFNDAALIATVTQPGYVDTSFPPGDKFYVVTAVNAVGESPYCKEIQATGTGPTPCVLPGILVSNDLLQGGGDNDSGQNTPIDGRVNAKELFVAEPFIGPGVEQIFFTLQVAPSTMGAAPPNSQWLIIWNRQGDDPADTEDSSFDRMYVAMITDAAGTTAFEYGKFGVPIDTSGSGVPNTRSNTPKKMGNIEGADSGSYDPLTGLIKISISNQKLRDIDGGASKYVAGTDLPATNVRTYFNRLDYPTQRSQNNASDITGDGTYTLVGNASCAVTQPVAGPGKLLNISTREQVGTGDNVLIGGFIITGSVPKRVIMRGIGPSLQKDGQPFAGRLEDPTLELHDSSSVIATNNDWKENQAEVEATGIPPTHDKESAIVKTLDPGAYTVILRGFQNSTGIALVEAYDLNATAASEMANISTRGLVGTGDNILIGGFFTGPNTTAHTNVVVRAIGPSIRNQVPNALNDPTLELRDQFGVLIGMNDNWKEGQQAEIQSVGLAPTEDAESALIKRLTPGPYTALVRGVNDTTGVGLVEVYHVP